MANDENLFFPAQSMDNQAFENENQFFPSNEPGLTSTTVDPSVAQERAKKYALALDNDPGVSEDDLYNMILTPGSIESERQFRAAMNDTENARIKHELMRSIVERAGMEGRKVNQNELEFIRNLSSEEVVQMRTDPQTFFEKAYASKRIAATEAADTREDVEPEEVHGTSAMADAMETIVGMKEVAQLVNEELQGRVKQLSMGAYAISAGSSALVPFVQWYNIQNAVKGAPTTSILPGSNKLEQIQYLWNLPTVEQFNTELRQAVEDIASRNVTDAAQFAREVLSYGGSDALFDNILVAGGDLATFIPGAGAIRMGKGVVRSARTGEKFRDVMKTLNKPNATEAEIADAIGDVRYAAGLTVQQKLRRLLSASGRRTYAMNDLFDEIPSFFDTEAILKGGRTIKTNIEVARRIAEDLTRQGSKVVDTMLFEALRSSARVTPEMLRLGADEAATKLRLQYNLPEDTILDVSTTLPDESLGGVSSARVAIGKTDGGLFEHPRTAYNMAKIMGLTEFEILAKPGGHYISVTRPIDLTSDRLRDQLRVEVRRTADDLGNYLASFLAPIRSGEDVLPERIIRDMKVATAGGSKFVELVRSMSTKAVAQKNNKDFHAFLKWQQRFERPNGEGYGKYSHSIAELEQDWFSQFNRMPTEGEIEAYFNYVRLNDIHYLSMNFTRYLEKQNIGLMEFEIGGLNNIEGKIIDRLPDQTDDFARILVMSDKPYVYRTDIPNINKGYDLNTARELVEKEGYAVVQLSQTGAERLLQSTDDVISHFTKRQGGGHRNIQYVVMKQPKSRPLSFKQSPYQPGGHSIAPSGYYGSIAQITPTRDGGGVYYGDRNLFHFADESVGKEVAKNWNTARKMLKDYMGALSLNARKIKKFKNEAFERKLAKFVNDNLPINYAEFKAMYIGRNASMNLDDPFVLRYYTQSSADAADLNELTGIKNNIQRFSDSQHNLYRGHVNLEFAQKRGEPIRAVERPGDPTKPLFGVAKMEYIDPYDALNRSMRSVVNQNNLNQVRMTMAENFIADFGDLLDDTTRAQRLDPTDAMFNGKFKDNISGDDRIRLRYAEAYRGRARQFFSLKSDTEKYYDYLAEKLIAPISPDMAKGMQRFIHESLGESAIISKIKGIAFHLNIGLFNPIQLVLQAQTFTHMASISPHFALNAANAATVQAWLNKAGYTDEAIKHAARYYGGNADEFIEMTQALKRSGWDIVGREVATAPDQLTTDVIQSKYGRFLDAGLVFFRNGEQFVRRSGFNIAYKEWRAANPTAKLTDEVIAGLIQRADLLSVNMTQASNAAWQRGIWSIPTQFMSYHVRLLEQLSGKRLTGWEKFRVLTGASLFYGIPIGVGGQALPFLPIYDTTRQWMLGNGMDPNNDIITRVATEGMLDVLIEQLLGEDTNFQNRYGPSGIPIVQDIVSGDKTALEIMAGPSGGTISNILADVAPIVPWMYSTLHPELNAQPIKMSDLTDVLANVKSLGIVEKMYIAYSTGKFLDRQGGVIDSGNTGTSAYVMALFGLTPQRIEDMYSIMADQRGREEAERKIQRQLDAVYTKMTDPSTSPSEQQYYFNRAQIYAESLPMQKRYDTLSSWMSRNQSRMERTIERLNSEPERQEAIRQLLQNNRPFEQRQNQFYGR